jgi:hypothetical protein
MDARKVGAGILGTTALVIGGIDASVLNERPLERIETVSEYRVEAKQVGNLVETTFPWKDQSGLKVVVDLGEPTMAERIADKRKRQVVTETVDFGDGGFKVDILLHERPDTNRFCYTIEGAENYDFFYQPPLTEQEIKEGAIRPPEIQGSYAVYHKTLRDHVNGRTNYATGKVMHIPRPQVWSLVDEEAKQWADLSYENGELCVTAPEEFLATAELPIRIDPTFGYTSIGLTTTNSGDDFVNAFGPISAPESGNVNSISLYSTNLSGGEMTVGVYSVSGGSPSSLLADSAGTSVSNGWNTINLDTPVAVTASTQYYLAYNLGGDTSSTIYYDANASFEWEWDGFTYSSGVLSNPFVKSGGGSNSRRYTIYATYTIPGGGSPPARQDAIWFD